MKGYVILPCFTVECKYDSLDWKMTCNDFLQWVFDFFFSPFWDGKVHIVN